MLTTRTGPLQQLRRPKVSKFLQSIVRRELGCQVPVSSDVGVFARTAIFVGTEQRFCTYSTVTT